MYILRPGPGKHGGAAVRTLYVYMYIFIMIIRARTKRPHIIIIIGIYTVVVYEVYSRLESIPGFGKLAIHLSRCLFVGKRSQRQPHINHTTNDHLGARHERGFLQKWGMWAQSFYGAFQLFSFSVYRWKILYNICNTQARTGYNVRRVAGISKRAKRNPPRLYTADMLL